MKASICDFCGTVLPTTSEAMLYDVVISVAESFEAQSKAERAVLFDAEDVCQKCAARVHAALAQLKKELGKK